MAESDASLTAAKAVPITIVEERADGSGVVEIPIVSQEERLDLSRTAGGQDRVERITREDLQDAVSNFAEWPGPVPVHRYPHRSQGEAAGPAEGFIERLFVKGGKLWARIELTASLFYEVKARMWRGFSVDYGRGASLPTKKLKGFVIARGVFTNQPASDVHYAVAASSEGVEIEGGQRSFSVLAQEAGHNSGGTKMSDDTMVRLATAEAESKNLREQVVSLTSKLSEKGNAYDRLAGELQEAKDAQETVRLSYEKKVADAQSELRTVKLSVERLESDVKEMAARLAKSEEDRKAARTEYEELVAQNLSSKVTALCRAAIKSGVPPAEIKKLGDYEKDPVGWLNNNFKSITTAEAFLNALPKDAAMSSLASGHIADANDDVAVTPEVARELSRRGLDPRLVGLKNSDELAALGRKQGKQ